MDIFESVVHVPILVQYKRAIILCNPNSEDPDQTNPLGAVWSGSTLFVYEKYIKYTGTPFNSVH